MDTRQEDNEVIKKILGGNQQAYAELVDLYKNYVFSIALRYCHNREDAEEVAQDSFVKAYRFLRDFKPGQARFSTWLYTITSNCCLTHMKKKRMHAAALEEEHSLYANSRLSADTVSNKLESKSNITMLNKAMELLPPPDAQVLGLFYQCEQSIEEISKILGTDISATKVRLHRARTRLKEKMEKHFSKEIKELYSL